LAGATICGVHFHPSATFAPKTGACQIESGGGRSQHFLHNLTRYHAPPLQELLTDSVTYWLIVQIFLLSSDVKDSDTFGVTIL